MKNFWKAANFKGHLLTAISYMIPIVCGAGFVIAIGMAFGGTSQDSLVMGKFNFLEALATLGGKALGMLPVIIATGIAFSVPVSRVSHRALWWVSRPTPSPPVSSAASSVVMSPAGSPWPSSSS